jgi:4-alpha-glucanotransferase
MNYDRSAGILMHPTSLPGPYGIGDLGPEAFAWVDFLVETGCKLWQVLPLGPTGYGDSPYQCFSAFAGNPYLISPDLLRKDGLLIPADLADAPSFPIDQVDYGPVITWKLAILDRAHRRFRSKNPGALHASLDAFRLEQADWLEDFALFMALKDAHHGAPWPTWAPALRDRHPQALEQAWQEHAEAIDRQIFRQFCFSRQWKALRDYANRKGVKIIGDIPIFVAHDSAEVWARPDLFNIDKSGNPTVVAGVPPDYFSPTGQLWGNPLYRWDVHAQTGYAWWLKRVRAILEQVDIIRLDHFRGFAGYWEVPAKEKTGKNGRWVPGPGKHFFQAVQDALGDLPILAEDLGEITPDVIELRDSFGLPGMRVMVFAFLTNPQDVFMPHNYISNSVVYTGTHDNDTVRGWYERIDEKERDFARRYLARSGDDISWDLIRAAWSSVSVLALAPTQDLLGLDNQARMNYPSRPSGNWGWRMLPGALTPHIRGRLREMNVLYGRYIPPPPPKGKKKAQP